MDCSDLGTNLDNYKLNGPSTIFYIPNFVTKAEEDELLRRVYSAPIPKWTQLSNRRLQNWGGLPHPNGMIAEEIPQWLATYMSRIQKLDVFGEKAANHVLINEYLPGQGIMPHLDGPLFYPTITTISLGSHTVLNLYHPIKDKDDNEEVSPIASFSDRLAFSILVQPRSLLILKDEAYSHFLHGIDEVKEDVISAIPNVNFFIPECDKEDTGTPQLLPRTTRVSLTIRHVPKTTKKVIKLRL